MHWILIAVFFLIHPSFAFSVTLDEKIGQMILVGIHGTDSHQEYPEQIAAQAQRGQIGGLIFFRHNITDKQQIMTFTNSFRSLSTSIPLFLAIDQEGGVVQRLSARNGFRDFDSARDVALRKTPEEAYAYYKEMGKMIRDAGFNLNLAPVVDIDYGQESPAIGKYGRSYSSSSKVVTEYASAMMRALRDEGVIHCLKHAPGHGSAKGDSHHGMVDITEYWDEENELAPYQALVSEGNVDMVMTAHVMHRKIDPEFPATLSTHFLKEKFRKETGWDGVVISDDLHMGAILDHFSLEDTVIQAILAGNDILLFSNNPLASQGRHQPHVDVPVKVIQIIKNAIQEGKLSEQQIDASFWKIMQLKSRLK